MRQYVIDAFTDSVFHGNQAAVCVMEKWPSEELMMNITRENNFSETAFTVKEGEKWHLRWFTPGGEIDLCGHATLGTAFVLLNFYEKEADRFRSFFKGRRERLSAEISSMGYGKGTSELTVTVNNSDWGTVQINSITPKIKSTGWKGLYFNNCEITLTAIPNEGYVFEGWSGLAKGKRQKTKITLSEASTVKASFRKE